MEKTTIFDKIQIESSSGTMTDITCYTKSVQLDEISDALPSFWRNPIKRFRAWLERRRLRKFIHGMPNITIEIDGVLYEKPYKWN